MMNSIADGRFIIPSVSLCAMARWTALLLRATVQSLIHVLRLYGLFPNYYNSVEQRFLPCKTSLAYSAVFLLAYLYFVGRYEIVLARFLGSTSTFGNKVLLFSLLISMYLGFICTGLAALLFRRRFLQLYNDFLGMWFRLHEGNPSAALDRKLLWSFVFKSVVIDGGSIVAIVLARPLLYYSEGVGRNLVIYDTLFHVFTFGINATFTSLFVVVGYLGAHYHRLINARVRSMHRMLHGCQQRPPSWQHSLVRLVLAGELRQLSLWHGEVNRMVHSFLGLHDLPIVLMVLKNFAILIGSAYGAYIHSIARVLMQASPNYGAFGFNVVFTVFYFFQFYYLVGSASLLTKRADKTGEILDDFSVRNFSDDHLDDMVFGV